MLYSILCLFYICIIYKHKIQNSKGNNEKKAVVLHIHSKVSTLNTEMTELESTEIREIKRRNVIRNVRGGEILLKHFNILVSRI